MAGLSARPSVNYAVVIEKGPTSHGAHVPALSGVAAVGRTLEEVTALIEEAIAAHVALLRELGQPVPEPRT